MVVSPFLISLEISSISLAGGIGHGDVGSAGSGSLYAPIVIKADGPPPSCDLTRDAPAGALTGLILNTWIDKYELPLRCILDRKLS